MTEEERAAAFRDRCAVRRAFHRQMCVRLQGDPVARADLQQRWQPVLGLTSRMRRIPPAPPAS